MILCVTDSGKQPPGHDMVNTIHAAISSIACNKTNLLEAYGAHINGAKRGIYS